MSQEQDHTPSPPNFMLLVTDSMISGITSREEDSLFRSEITRKKHIEVNSRRQLPKYFQQLIFSQKRFVTHRQYGSSYIVS